MLLKILLESVLNLSFWRGKPVANMIFLTAVRYFSLHAETALRGPSWTVGIIE
jgi:hypothetical protein